MSLPRYPQYSSNNAARSPASQLPSPTQAQNQLKTGRKSANSSNIPVPASKGYTSRGSNINPSSYRSKNEFSENEDFGDDANLSREECIVLLQPRMQPQGQENLSSGNVTPTNPISDPQDLAIFERMNTSATAKSRYNIDITDSPMNTIRYNNISRDNGSQRNSMNIQFQGSNRNSLDHPQSNRSSLDVSQSSYSTLIIHDNENQSSIFRNDSYFSNYSPSPPNCASKINPKSHDNPKDLTENDQQYLNQSYVLKHLAREANQMQNNTKNPNSTQNKSTRDSGLSENNSSNNQSSFDATSLKTKSKSQPDLTKLIDHQQSNVSSAVNTLNNDLEVLAVENLKLREQLNDCLMKVAKSQKLEQEVSNLMTVHEELVQSCERRERLERTARTRLQQDCRRFQDNNKSLREQVEVMQQQLLLISNQQQQQQNVATGRNQQDMVACLIQQNKELVDANKRQYIEIQAQSATLEEQRIHINVLDAALKRLEEELRQKQLYQKQLQSLMHANEKKEKLQYELDKEINKKLAQNNDLDSSNMSKWLFRDKDPEMSSAEAAALDHHNHNNNSQDHDILPLDSQRIVNELHARLKLVEHRLIEKEDTIRQLQELKPNLYGKNFNMPSSTQLYNPTNYENLTSSCATSTKTFSTTSNASIDALLLGAYSGIYQSGYSQNLNSSGVSPNTSCSSTSTFQQHHQHPSTSSNASNYMNYDEQRKSIDDELKKLDTQLLSKVSELTLMQYNLQSQESRNSMVQQSRSGSSCHYEVPNNSSNQMNQCLGSTNKYRPQNKLFTSMNSISYSADVDQDDQEIFY